MVLSPFSIMIGLYNSSDPGWTQTICLWVSGVGTTIIIHLKLPQWFPCAATAENHSFKEWRTPSYSQCRAVKLPLMTGSPDRVWVSSPSSHLCSDMETAQWHKETLPMVSDTLDHFPLLNVVIILSLGQLPSFPRNPTRTKTLRY